MLKPGTSALFMIFEKVTPDKAAAERQQELHGQTPAGA